MLFRCFLDTDSSNPMVIAPVLSRAVYILLMCMLPVCLSANLLVDLEHFIETDGFIEDVDHDEVMPYIMNYLESPRHTEVILSRTLMYLPLVEQELKRHGLPEELKVLPLIESCYDPRVGSSKGALGLWQFMTITAQEMGLRVTADVDERRDPGRSTGAALEYLKYLYGKYGDWSVAFAAYNAGPGKVNRAIKLSGGNKSFNAIKYYLPRETRDYIPKYLAAQYIVSRYGEHGLNPDLPDLDLQWTSTVTVYREINLEEVAACTQVPVETLARLNPGLNHHVIPAIDGGYKLVLPHRVRTLFEDYQTDTPRNAYCLEYSQYEYEVDDRTTIYEIANKFDINPYLIKYWNQMTQPTVKRGEVLMIYQVLNPCGRSGDSDIVPNPFAKLPSRISAEEIMHLAALDYALRLEEELNWELHQSRPGMYVMD